MYIKKNKNTERHKFLFIIKLSRESQLFDFD